MQGNSPSNDDVNSQESTTESQARHIRNIVIAREVHGIDIPDRRQQPENVEVAIAEPVETLEASGVVT